MSIGNVGFGLGRLKRKLAQWPGSLRSEVRDPFICRTSIVTGIEDIVQTTGMTSTLIVRIILRHCTDNAVVVRLAALEVAFGRSLRYDSHVPVPHGTMTAVVDLKVHGVGVQGVFVDEILYDFQRGIVNAPGHMLVVGVLHEELDLFDAGVSGYLRGDGNPPVE